MINSIDKIIIDPRCKINYASFYIYGFWSLFGKRKMNFNGTPFIALTRNSQQEYDRGLALLLIKSENFQKKIFIDFNDLSSIDELAYEWSDLYCKINMPLANVTTKFQDKLFTIGPSFGISLWSWPMLAFNCFNNYLKSKNHFNLDIRRWISDYMYTNIRRLRIEEYEHSSSHQDYCFHISTLWYDHLTDKTTNFYRGHFLKACKKIYNDFDGGFFYIPSHAVVKEYPSYIKYQEEYSEFLIAKRISPKTYIKKTKKSAIVFNTPSVGGCHGWKLAEYLSMGKAIISTPLSNRMPGEFIPGVHYYLVKNEEEINDAILFLYHNNDYRLNLEIEALKYFDNYLSPEKVIERIIEKANH